MSKTQEMLDIVRNNYELAKAHRSKMLNEMTQLREQQGILLEQLQEVIKARNFWQGESLKKDVEIIQKDREIEELKKKIPVKATPSYETLVSSQ